MNILVATIFVGFFGTLARAQFYPFLGQEITSCFGSACPVIPAGTPAYCIRPGRIYPYFGWLCRDCDVVIEGCFRPLQQSPDLPRCPHIPCTPVPNVSPSCVIPGPTLRWNGNQCKGCPTADPFCPGLQICRNHILDCFGVPDGISKECIEQTVTSYQGVACKTCPTLKPECAKQNTPPSAPTKVDNNEPQSCPHIPCSPVPNVSPSCIIPGPMLSWNGSECRGCPTADPFCPGLEICRNHLMGCFGVPEGISKDCIEHMVTTYQGTVCKTCPTVKPECTRRNSPSPVPGKKPPRCPHIRCSPIPNVSPSCVIPGPTLTYNGNECRGCPTADPFCPGLEICRNHIVDCFGVPEGISKECIEQVVTTYQGVACKTCPTLKKDCTKRSSSTSVQNSELQQCPHIPCSPVPNVSPSCVIPGPTLRWNGSECKGCPTADPFCPGLQICRNHLMGCFGVPEGISKDCIEHMVTTYQGAACKTCPTVKPECTRRFFSGDANTNVGGVV